MMFTLTDLGFQTVLNILCSLLELNNINPDELEYIFRCWWVFCVFEHSVLHAELLDGAVKGAKRVEHLIDSPKRNLQSVNAHFRIWIFSGDDLPCLRKCETNSSCVDVAKLHTLLWFRAIHHSVAVLRLSSAVVNQTCQRAKGSE